MAAEHEEGATRMQRNIDAIDAAIAKRDTQIAELKETVRKLQQENIRLSSDLLRCRRDR